MRDVQPQWIDRRAVVVVAAAAAAAAIEEGVEGSPRWWSPIRSYLGESSREGEGREILERAGVPVCPAREINAACLRKERGHARVHRRAGLLSDYLSISLSSAAPTS